MNEWQPIETAPRNGTRIIGAFEFGEDFIPTVGTIVFRAWGGHKAAWWFEDINDSFLVKPTHWMPLPDPPEGAA